MFLYLTAILLPLKVLCVDLNIFLERFLIFLFVNCLFVSFHLHLFLQLSLHLLTLLGYFQLAILCFLIILLIVFLYNIIPLNFSHSNSFILCEHLQLLFNIFNLITSDRLNIITLTWCHATRLRLFRLSTELFILPLTFTL